ncbi:hypothetical protein FA13DRAFT_1705806 [Coprinellus micaceus]|uniref:Uncharacterized protein n=1 Tax=Coprinellus micaceus TaxID=71717 RepID=A0A4Y7TU42_COPMI|nr:hypothetical protein FA13DRAFT_1705806 [Coprinellus micaceus]
MPYKSSQSVERFRSSILYKFALPIWQAFRIVFGFTSCLPIAMAASSTLEIVGRILVDARSLSCRWLGANVIVHTSVALYPTHPVPGRATLILHQALLNCNGATVDFICTLVGYPSDYFRVLAQANRCKLRARRRPDNSPVSWLTDVTGELWGFFPTLSDLTGDDMHKCVYVVQNIQILVHRCEMAVYGSGYTPQLRRSVTLRHAPDPETQIPATPSCVAYIFVPNALGGPKVFRGIDEKHIFYFAKV